MKEMMIKTGTRQEVVDYLHSISKPHPGRLWMDDTAHIGETYEVALHPIEEQIDNMIAEGSPFVAVRLFKVSKSIHPEFPEWLSHEEIVEKFLITDYGTIRADMQLEMIDDLERRGRRIKAIKMVMQMEMDAEERWDRILAIVDGYYISQGKL